MLRKVVYEFNCFFELKMTIVNVLKFFYSYLLNISVQDVL